jgi:hypothetical protein
VTDEHDLQIKANQLKSFVEKGHRVRVVVKFEKREKAHPDKGFEAINNFLKMIEEFATVERPPVFEGKNIMARVQKKTSVCLLFETDLAVILNSSPRMRRVLSIHSTFMPAIYSVV